MVEPVLTENAFARMAKNDPIVALTHASIPNAITKEHVKMERAIVLNFITANRAIFTLLTPI